MGEGPKNNKLVLVWWPMCEPPDENCAKPLIVPLSTIQVAIKGMAGTKELPEVRIPNRDLQKPGCIIFSPDIMILSWADS